MTGAATAVRGSEALRKSVHIAMGEFALALRWLTPLQAAICALVALGFNLLVLHRLTGRKLLRDAEQARAADLPQQPEGQRRAPSVVTAVVAGVVDQLRGQRARRGDRLGDRAVRRHESTRVWTTLRTAVGAARGAPWAARGPPHMLWQPPLAAALHAALTAH